MFNTLDLILNTKDYSFAHFDHEGLGGSTKYIATSKSGEYPKKLIVKHNCEFAISCNGFVFGRIGELLGIKVPKTYMFDVSPDDRYLFESPCVAGMEFIEGFQPIDISVVKTTPKLEKAFVECFVLHALLSDFDDNVQLAYVPGDTIYPFDFDESFWFDKGLFQFTFKHYDLAESQIIRRLSAVADKGVKIKFDVCYQVLCKELGYSQEKANLPYFFDVLNRFCSLKKEEVFSITDTLLDFFPDLVSAFYDEYIRIMQECTKEYIKRNKV